MSDDGKNKPAPETVAPKPLGEKPAAEKPAAEKPAAEKPAADKPAAEKPAAEKPAAEKSPAEKPALAAAEAPAAETRDAGAEKQPSPGAAARAVARPPAGTSAASVAAAAEAAEAAAKTPTSPGIPKAAVAARVAALGPPPRPGVLDRIRQLDLLVIAVVAALLVGGWQLGKRWGMATDIYVSATTGLSLRYPQGWLCAESTALEEGELARVECVDPYSEGAAKARLRVVVVEVPPEAAAFGVAAYLSLNRPHDEPLYSEISGADAPLSGNPGRRTEYAYAWSEPLSHDVPAVLHALEAYALKGNRLYTVTYASEKDAFEKDRRRIEYILGSVVIP
jgi:hypothetical protein